MDFELNETQAALREAAVDFARDALAPNAAEWDAENHTTCIPWCPTTDRYNRYSPRSASQGPVGPLNLYYDYGGDASVDERSVGQQPPDRGQGERPGGVATHDHVRELVTDDRRAEPWPGEVDLP